MQAAKALPAKPAAFDRSRQHRRAMEAKIHVARKQMDMDPDDYRQIMLDATGKISMKDCSDADLGKLLDRLKAKGFRPIPRKKVAQHPMARKARAMWISLYHLGVVHNQAEDALEAFACQQLKCERMVWARQSDSEKLIGALRSMAERNGWLQHCRVTGKRLSPDALQSSLCHVILAKLKEAGIAPVEWDLATAMWRLCGIENARERGWSAEDYHALAAALGKKLREHKSAFQTIRGKQGHVIIDEAANFSGGRA